MSDVAASCEPQRLQGFITFPSSGGATQLDVDTLNERLRSNGAIRHRHALRPDEAHACIFAFDDVIVDTRAVQRAAWQRLAAEEELPFPQAQAERQLFDIRPERVITEVNLQRHLSAACSLQSGPVHLASIVHALVVVVSIGSRRSCEQVLQWTRDWGRARELAHRVAVIFAEEVAKVGPDVRVALD